ncbi:transposable element Tcb1 transposase [Trichonephila clavipes]|nr:transposable element Tcb1 transposase [Trichonephila clavipes]
MFGMSSRHHIDDFMRGRIIAKIEEGRKITDVARKFDIAHSVVSRLWKSYKTTGMCSRWHGGGRVRTKQISRKTVARRLRGGGLYTRRPVVCVPLTRQHRTARLQWCREHHNWTEQNWACVQFSDESRFSLSSDCRRQLIWRENGTAYRPENIQEKDRYPTCSIMVWAGIMINGRTRLHVVANGTMTGQRYIDEVLLPHVDCLDSEGIQRLVWPARPPDLNPIENVWDALGRQVAGRNYPPANKNTLIRALTEEWDKLPQQLLDNIVQNDAIIVRGPGTLPPCVAIFMSTFHQKVHSSKVLSELLDFSGMTAEEFSRKVHPYILSSHNKYKVANALQSARSCAEQISKCRRPLNLSIIVRAHGYTVSKFAYFEGVLDERNAASAALIFADLLRGHAVQLKGSGDSDWKVNALCLGFIDFMNYYHLFSKESIPLLAKIYMNEWKSVS